MELNNYWAKDDATTICEHNCKLRHCLDVMFDLGYIKSQHLYELISQACEYHDYGKANAEFQRRVRNKNLHFDENKEISHNVLSMYFVDRGKFENDEDFYKVLFAVGYHHNYCDVMNVIETKKEVIDSLLSEFEVKKLKRSVFKKIISIMQNEEAILLKGFLHKCDYGASGGYIPELKNDFLNEGLENLRLKWREMQIYCGNHTDENIMVVAQTGMGKTEGALKWIGNNKGFFVLPLKTAINAMYDRIRKNIVCQNVENRLAVLHSESTAYLMKNYYENEEKVAVEYNKRGKQLSMPLTITTMDQLFDFVFKYNGYEMKLTTFSYSKIVIDEIQMYGAELLAYLVYGVKKIIEMGGKVAIVTATLPPFVKDLFGNEFKYAEFIDDNKLRHNVVVKKEYINACDIVSKYNENREKGRSNKILVICNTIKKAQAVYDEIVEMLPEEVKNINMLHSRFIRKDRSKKEAEIIAVGKTDYSGDEIWITTSVVEASLDIDFDYLFTELQDLNSLFQRLGRCNRKGEKPVDEPNCFVYTEIEPSLLNVGKGKGFIDAKIYNLSREAIMTVNGVLKESKKLELINEYFSSERLAGSEFMRKYNQVYDGLENMELYKLDSKDIDLRHISSVAVIPKVIYDEIEELFDEISKNISYADSYEKVKLIDKINDYTVSIPYYEFIKSKKYADISLKNRGIASVIECEYNEEKGFKVVLDKGYCPATFW